MKRAFCALALLFLSFSAHADSAWWQACDHCSTDTQFSGAAIQAPEPWEFVYVTNRQSNTTRLYSRFTTWEDMDGGMVRMTHVIEQPMSQALKSVFEQAVANSRVTEINLPRQDLVGLSGAGPADSVISDIRFARIPNSLRGSLTVWMGNSPYIPSRSSVNQSIGVSGPGVGGFSMGAGFGVREIPIRIGIAYPDGSVLWVTWNPDGSLTDWSATDADGNPIEFNPDGTVAPVGAGFGGEGFLFGPGNTDVSQAALDFIIEFDRQPVSFDCRAETTPEGLRIICRRR